MSRPFWWFSGASVEELSRQLTAHPEARLEVHLDGERMTFYVVAPGQAVALDGGGGIDDSHICPPICP